MIRILKFEELTAYQLYEILKLRAEIFVVEQNCPYLDTDGKDFQSFHLLVEEEGEVVSYLRILPKGVSYETASIGRVLTKKCRRGRGFSRRAMQVAIDFIRNEWQLSEITISAQVYLVDFYGSLGFVSVGESYLEDDLPHIKMKFTEQ